MKSAGMKGKIGIIDRSVLAIPLRFKRLYPVDIRAETGAEAGIAFAISMK
jgi:hypothetical protein